VTRLRYKNGSHIDIPRDEIPFVESVNEFDDTVNKLLIDLSPDAQMEVYPGSVAAQRYESMMSKYGVKFTEKVIHRKAP
jgi:hypothetical protein